jgi:signal transduction histidine kinase
MTFLSAAGGWWLAGRVIAPITELADLVSHADPATSRVQNLPHDEIGDALEAYLARLYGFIDREHAFTADVSHELRTPVAIIQGAVEVIREDETLTAAQRERFQRIDRAAQDMAQLIRALLLLAREPGTGGAAEPSCDVAAIVRETVEKHRYMLRGKGTEVELAILAEPRLPAEGVLLAVVVANLVRNAFSFTETGKVTLTLDADGLRVVDTGQGIRGEELRHVFRRYYRGATSEGAGIGLSLVKRICDRYGWSILIESSEGRGTTAQLTFSRQAT